MAALKLNASTKLQWYKSNHTIQRGSSFPYLEQASFKCLDTEQRSTTALGGDHRAGRSEQMVFTTEALTLHMEIGPEMESTEALNWNYEKVKRNQYEQEGILTWSNKLS